MSDAAVAAAAGTQDRQRSPRLSLQNYTIVRTNIKAGPGQARSSNLDFSKCFLDGSFQSPDRSPPYVSAVNPRLKFGYVSSFIHTCQNSVWQAAAQFFFFLLD